MQIAVLTFDGFNELDSFVAAAILNRLKAKGWAAHITAPTEEVTSMNGVAVQRQKPLEFANEADAVIVGSGVRTRDIAADAGLLARLQLDPARQLIAAQCSGTLLLARLGLIGALPACTDLTTKPWVIEAGVSVLDAPFVAHGNVATAGGCLASQYLAAWIMARGGPQDATTILGITMFKAVFTDLRPAYAAAISVVMLVILAAASFLTLKLGRRP